MVDKIKKAEEWYNKNAYIYERFSIEVAQIIEKILKSKEIPYQSISQRVKERASYLNKCKKDQYLNPVKEIMDVAGIRIIAYTNNDVKKICEVIEQEFEIDSENSGNKIDKMDEDKVGYLSVHYIAKLNNKRAGLIENNTYKNCKCEIQVRTLLQHAWAEIEHDRNYKFSAVLPKDIKRRFYLISGVLEMMDREFDNLSSEIDEYSKIVETKTKESDFDIDIDTESLTQYMLLKFDNNPYIKRPTDGILVHKEVIQELLRFGFVKIKNIDQELSEEVISKLLSYRGVLTYVGLLRSLMLLLDVKKYFSIAYDKDWTFVSNSLVIHWEEIGITEIREYLRIAEIDII